MKEENSSKVANTKARKERRLRKKFEELSKRYPENKYEIRERIIVRVSGRRPHKTKGAKGGILHRDTGK